MRTPRLMSCKGLEGTGRAQWRGFRMAAWTREGSVVASACGHVRMTVAQSPRALRRIKGTASSLRQYTGVLAAFDVRAAAAVTQALLQPSTSGWHPLTRATYTHKRCRCPLPHSLPAAAAATSTCICL